MLNHSVKNGTNALRFGSSLGTYENDVSLKQQQPPSFNYENIGVKKWNHAGHTGGDSPAKATANQLEVNEFRHAYIPSYKNMHNFNQELTEAFTSAPSPPGEDRESINATVGLDLSNKFGWNGKSSIKRQSSGVGSSANDESDGNDTDLTNMSRQRAGKFHETPSMRSKASSSSLNEEHMNDGVLNASPQFNSTTSTLFNSTHNRSVVYNETPVSTQHSFSSVAFQKRASSHLWSAEQSPNMPAVPTVAEAEAINFIMLVGLLLGLTISKILQYLVIYFKWFQNQVLHLRNAFLGPHGSMWDILNFDDDSRYNLRMKLFLAPIVGTCCLLYGFVAILIFTIRFFLARAPNGLVDFIQRLSF